MTDTALSQKPSKPVIAVENLARGTSRLARAMASGRILTLIQCVRLPIVVVMGVAQLWPLAAAAVNTASLRGSDPPIRRLGGQAQLGYVLNATNTKCASWCASSRDGKLRLRAQSLAQQIWSRDRVSTFIDVSIGDEFVIIGFSPLRLR